MKFYLHTKHKEKRAHCKIEIDLEKHSNLYLFKFWFLQTNLKNTKK